jgi:serine/threonine protein phosphatase PrpC
MDACAVLERQIVEIDVERQKKLLASNKESQGGGMADAHSFAGSVAAVIVIYPTQSNLGDYSSKIELTVAHVGDCRAVLSDNGVSFNCF